MSEISFLNSRGGRIVGTLYPGAHQSIVIMAHGFSSDRTSNGRFGKLAQSFQQAGLSALAIDFSGCGESDDDILMASKQEDDLRSAVGYVKSVGYQQIGLYGHSLGSLICLRSFTPQIKAMVLSGALTGPMHYDWNLYYSEGQMQELATKGYITVTRNEGVRKQALVSQQMLNDFAEIDQQELLQRVSCPVLIIHGNREDDEEELQLCQHSLEGMKYLSTDSKLEVIDGANHRFYEHMDVLCQLATDWFIKHFTTETTNEK